MKPISTFTLKSNLRKKYLAKRRALSFEYRQMAEARAAEILVHHPSFEKSEHIACYLPVKDEFDPRRIIEAIWQAKKQCYLPVLDWRDAPFGKVLSFVRYHEGDALQLNRYDIFEPINRENQISPPDLDLVLTPLIAFDANGTRLGTGGGYYDRTFSTMETRDKPLLYGLAFNVQQAELLPQDSWDVPLNGVITEGRFILSHRS